MTNTTDQGGLLSFAGVQSISFSPGPATRENFLYLINAGTHTADGEYALNGLDDAYTLIYTLSGAGHVDLTDCGCSISGQQGVLLNRGRGCLLAGDNRPEEPWQFMHFQMSGASFPAYYRQLAASRASARQGESSAPMSQEPPLVLFQTKEGSAADAEIHKLARAAMLQNNPHHELIASTAIISLLTELIVNGISSDSAARPMPRYIDGIMQYINDHYRQQITLDELAAEFNVSKYHLSREFKKYTGFSPNEYVISVRLNRAKELLRHTGRTITEIAQITGCGDVNHFIQLFKSRENVTPAVFRRRWHREGDN